MKTVLRSHHNRVSVGPVPRRDLKRTCALLGKPKEFEEGATDVKLRGCCKTDNFEAEPMSLLFLLSHWKDHKIKKQIHIPPTSWQRLFVRWS